MDYDKYHEAVEKRREVVAEMIKESNKSEGWTRRKEIVRGGEYPSSDVERTVTVSADGRFKIYPDGGMVTSKIDGVRGDSYRRWAWHGYAMSDAEYNKALKDGTDVRHLDGPGWRGYSLNREDTVRGHKENVAKWRLGETLPPLVRRSAFR